MSITTLLRVSWTKHLEEATVGITLIWNQKKSLGLMFPGKSVKKTDYLYLEHPNEVLAVDKFDDKII